jgi:hypothetical protein
MSQDALIAKFRTNAAYGGVNFSAADHIVNAVLALPAAADLSVLQAALTTALSPQPEHA